MSKINNAWVASNGRPVNKKGQASKLPVPFSVCESQDERVAPNGRPAARNESSALEVSTAGLFGDRTRSYISLTGSPAQSMDSPLWVLSPIFHIVGVTSKAWPLPVTRRAL